MPRRQKQTQQFQGYELVVLKWYVGYFLCRAEKFQNKGSVELALDKELLSPIKGVSAGQPVVMG